MKKFGSKSGFTLVELIVVIAILGILAGIAVPTYSAYITKANDATDYTKLDAIKTAAVFAYTEQTVKADPTADTTVTSIDVSAGNPASSVKVNGTTAADVVDISDYYKETIAFKGETFKNGATWAAGVWSAK